MSCPLYPGSNSLRLPISVRANTSLGHSLVDSDYSLWYLTKQVHLVVLQLPCEVN